MNRFSGSFRIDRSVFTNVDILFYCTMVSNEIVFSETHRLYVFQRGQRKKRINEICEK